MSLLVYWHNKSRRDHKRGAGRTACCTLLHLASQTGVVSLLGSARVGERRLSDQRHSLLVHVGHSRLLEGLHLALGTESWNLDVPVVLYLS